MKKTKFPITLNFVWTACAVALTAGACQSPPDFADSDGSDADLGGSGDDSDSDSDSDSGTGGGNGSGGLCGALSCAESTETADLVPANLLFVVDKSGSMNCNPRPTDLTCDNPIKVDENELSKWEITQDALTGSSGALQVLAGQAGVSVGLSLFPLDDNCQVVESGDVSV